MVLSKRCFSEWCVPRVARICKGRGHQNGFWAFFGSLPLRKGSTLSQAEVRNLKNNVWKSEDRGCLGEGRLGVPSQVWEFRFLLSFPLFPRENRSSRNVWENTWKSQTSVLQTSAAF